MEQKTNIVYTIADFQRYHSGQMNETDMNALEKAALEDPFLSDALEGYSFTETGEADMVELKRRISKKEKKGNTFLFFRDKKMAWMSAAAMLILISGTLYISIKLNSGGEDKILAKTESSKNQYHALTADSAPATENDLSSSPSATDTIKINSNQIADQKHPEMTSSGADNSYTYIAPSSSIVEKPAPGTYKLKEFAEKDSMMIAQNILKDNPAPMSDIIVEKKEQAKRDVAKEESTLTDSVITLNKIPANKKNTYRFTGKVVDEQGAAIPFVSINDTMRKSVFKTDAFGKYAVIGNDSSLFATIGTAGYNVNQQFLRSNTDETIVLSRNQEEISPVVVTALGKAREKTSAGYSTARVMSGELSRKDSALKTATGTDKFWQYINDSIRKPQNKDGIFYKGAVTLSFKIKKDGTPDHIKIINPLCQPCDEEAKRLLLNGPKWSYTGDKRTTLTISF